MTRAQRVKAVRKFMKTSSKGVRRRLVQAIRKFAEQVGKAAAMLDPANPVIADVDGFHGTYMVNRCPCITRARGGNGFFLMSRGRRLTVSELLRLQGFPTYILRCQAKASCSNRLLGAMVGNAMSCNILERILVRLLPACGLSFGASLHDRWGESC